METEEIQTQRAKEPELSGGEPRFGWRAADREAVVFWEKPERPTKKGCRVLVNGADAGAVRATHVRLKDLEPCTEYRVEVLDVGAGEILGGVLVTTGKARRRRNVAEAPYFAKGDGRTMNTEALQRAIDDCGPEETVYLPEGVFLTGCLRLHSDMELYLEKGAVLQGTDRPEDYLPKILSRFEGYEMECYSSLLNLGFLDHAAGPNCSRVAIRGEGTIASGGRVLAERIMEAERRRLAQFLKDLGDGISAYENENTIPGRARPRLINLSNCQDVWISGLSLKNGASWNVHMIYSKDIVTDGCSFASEGVWNGDGWDPDSSEDCVIFNCDFDTGDDAVAVKSGKNPEGNVIARPCRRIRIFDCRCVCGHGISIGSEMSGGVEDVKIWDCDISGTLYGFHIKGTKKRGGYVRDISVRDCTAPRIRIRCVGYNDDGEAAPAPPVFEKFRFENVKLLCRYREEDGTKHPCLGVEIYGFDPPAYPVRDVEFSGLSFPDGRTAREDVRLESCQGVRFL